MARYAALIKGINVGGNKKVAMADLRELLVGLGFADVATVLQSGNAVFDVGDCREVDPRRLAGRIEQALVERLATTARCVVRSASEIAAVAGGNPLLETMTDGSRMLAVFLSTAPDPGRLAAHDPTSLDPERIRVGEAVVYQWCPDGISAAPPVGPFVEKHLGVVATARNWNTVTKLAALLR